MRKEKIGNRKVVILIESFRLGGAERQAYLLARNLNLLGKEVEVWSIRKDLGIVGEMLDADNITWKVNNIRVKSRTRKLSWKFTLILDLVSFILKLKINGVHSIIPFTYYPNIVTGLTAKFTKSKLVLWNQRDEGRFFNGLKLENTALRNVTYFISNSSQGEEFLKNRIPGIKVIKIFNGIQNSTPQNNSEHWYKQLGIESLDKERVHLSLMIANLHYKKDHITLLKAWKIISSQRSEAVLLLAGRKDGAYKDLANYVKENNLQDNVCLLGAVNDINGLLQICNLVVFSSENEGCPNGVLEGMAKGLPVVATDIPGIRDAVGTDYKFLFPPKDYIVFAENIIHFIDDPEFSKTVGYHLKYRIDTYFSVEKMVQSYLHIIQRLQK